MARTVRRTVRVKVSHPVIKVTRSGQVSCVYCGRLNQVYAGQTNPVCGHCRNPLPFSLS